MAEPNESTQLIPKHHPMKNTNNNKITDSLILTISINSETTNDPLSNATEITDPHSGYHVHDPGATTGAISGPISDHWDRGWAWFVALGAGICNLIIFGSLRSAGIILNEVSARFGASSFQSTLVIIIHVVCIILCTPLTTHLTNRVSCRLLVMVGGVSISLGLLAASLGGSLPWAYVGLGFLCGTGGGLVLPTSYIVVNQHFKEKRSKAFAVSTAGIGIGGLVFSPVLAYWFATYGYSGALLLNAGLFLNLQVGGALMRPPPVVVSGNDSDKSDANSRTESEQSSKNIEDEGQQEYQETEGVKSDANLLTGGKRSSNNVEHQEAPRCKDAHNEEAQSCAHLELDSESTVEQKKRDVKGSSEVSSQFPETAVLHEISLADDTETLPLLSEVCKPSSSSAVLNDSKDRTSTTDKQGNNTEVLSLSSQVKESESVVQLHNPKQSTYKHKSSKLALLANPTFVMYMANMTGATIPSFLTFLPAYGLELGLSTGQSSLYLSANGFTDILGRLASGFVFDSILHGRKRLYHSLIGVGAGVTVLLCGFASSTTTLLVLTLLQGFVEGAFNAQRTVVAFEFVDPHHMADGIGLIIFAECIGIMLGPVIQSVIKDSLGSHSLGFVIGGTLFAGTSLIMTLDFFVRTIVRNLNGDMRI